MEIISPCTGVLCTELSDDLDDDGVRILGEFVDRLEDLEDEEVIAGKQQVVKTAAEDVGADEAEEDAVMVIIDDVAEDL